MRKSFNFHRKGIILIVLLMLFLTSTPFALETHDSTLHKTDVAPKAPRASATPVSSHSTFLIHNPAAMHTLTRLQKQGASPSGTNLTLPEPNYDEQLGLTFGQNSTSLSYNITAVAQSDSYGYGPAYLLNGLTDRGDWYQVGISWDWPFSGGGYVVGFNFNYEVFSSTGQSIFPSSGGGGLSTYSGKVNPGDIVLLSLYLSGGQVFMYSKDWNTSSVAYENYADLGATLFLGLSNADNSQGFFSGTMTEMYRVAAFYGQESKVIYDNDKSNLTSGTLWADERNMNTTLFAHASPEMSFVNADLLQFFSSNGATIGADAYQFITGETSLFAVNLSYAIQSGGSGYSAPTLTYYSNGTQRNTLLSNQPTTYYMDNGSSWSANAILVGSGSTQRWIALQATNGIASSSISQVLAYDHQFEATINASPTTEGTTSPSGVNWFDAGSQVPIHASGNGLYLFTRWDALTPTVSFGNFKSPETNVTLSGPGSFDAVFGQVALSLSAYSGKVTQGAQTNQNLSLTGTGGEAALSLSALPAGVKVNFGQGSAVPSINGTEIPITISVPQTTAPGTYNFTIFANSTQGNDFATYSLVVLRAFPLTFNLLVNASESFPPVLNYTFNGVAKSENLSGRYETLSTDYGSNWSVNAILAGSNSSERWITPDKTNGTATSTSTIILHYFLQYSAEFRFQVKDGSMPSVLPSVNLTIFGTSRTLGINKTASFTWVDASSTYSYSSVLNTNKSIFERWAVAANETGRITTAGIVNGIYYHQIKFGVAYNLTGGGDSFTPPNFSFTTFGTKLNETLYSTITQFWADAGTSWYAPKLLTGSNQDERWVGTNVSGTARLSPITSIDLSYAHQYYLRISSATSQGGSVKPASAWYAANSTIQVSQNPTLGWRFIQWSGTEQISNGSLELTAPTNLSAVFYPGVSISVPNTAKITYSYGSVRGSLPPGSSTVIYPPPGTTVSVSASPNSIFYTLNSWKLGNYTEGSASTYTLVVSGPVSLTPQIDYNYYLVAGILGALFAAAFSMLFILRKKSSSSSPTAAIHSQDSESAEID